MMAWCEAEGVAYLFGLAPNARLKAVLAPEAWEAARLAKQWRDVRALLESFEEEDSIPMSVVSDIFGRLEDPVSYITKGAHMSRRGSSLRARREAEMQSLSTPE